MTKHDRKTLNPNGDFYVTTFCNFAHRLSDGMPIQHECYVLLPNVLVHEYIYGARAVLNSFPTNSNQSYFKGS